MTITKHRYRSIAGAVRRIRELQRQVDYLQEIVRKWEQDRILLAKLAAKGPAFDNPLVAWEAEKVRDAVLSLSGLNPDGSFKRRPSTMNPPWLRRESPVAATCAAGTSLDATRITSSRAAWGRAPGSTPRGTS